LHGGETAETPHQKVKENGEIGLHTISIHSNLVPIPHIGTIHQIILRQRRVILKVQTNGYKERSNLLDFSLTRVVNQDAKSGNTRKQEVKIRSEANA
jgi:hypothetical protein